MQCICHYVPAIIVLHTGCVAQLNFQVSLFNKISVEIMIA